MIVDADATLINAHLAEEHAAPTFKRGFGFDPSATFAGHGGQGTGEPLAGLLQAGNAISSTAAGHISVVKAALAHYPVAGAGVGRRARS